MKIAAIPTLLKLLDITGAFVTNAIGCQQKIAKQIMCQQALHINGNLLSISG